MVASDEQWLVEAAPMSEAFMTPRECADRIGIGRVTGDYIRGEIRDGLLKAEIIVRPVRPGRERSKRAIRVYEDDFKVYVKRYWPRVYARLFPGAA
jgi:hypothetical protein